MLHRRSIAKSAAVALMMAVAGPALVACEEQTAGTDGGAPPPQQGMAPAEPAPGAPGAPPPAAPPAD